MTFDSEKVRTEKFREVPTQEFVPQSKLFGENFTTFFLHLKHL